jgi:DNA-binding MarR family transcriptional regulator
METQSAELDSLARSLIALRRAVLRDGFLDAIRSMADHELSVAQLATLMLLESEGGSTVGDLARDLGRSLSATSRSLDQLVKRGLVCRQEAAHDRRIKHVTLDEQGRELIGRVQRRRAEAQYAVMAALSSDERRLVMQAMTLLAEAAERRRTETPPPTS